MSARDDICNLIAAYCQAIDDGRADDVTALFCAEGTVEIPGMGTHTGHDALRAAYEGWKPRGPQRHVVVNTNVNGDRAVSDLLFLVMGEKGWRIQMVGRYDDEFCTHNGDLRFHRRAASFVS